LRLDTTRLAGAPGRLAGLGLAGMSAALWAIGGIAAQDLFARHHVDPGWLAGVRMACGGLLLLLVFRPAWPRRQAGLLIAVAVLGIAGAQYTWFVAIDKSNVALATFVQYSAVPMTAGWQMLRRQVRPTARRLTAVAAAGTGVWLLAAGVPGGLRASRADQAGVAAAVFLGVTLRAPQYAGGVLTMIAVLLLATADPLAPGGRTTGRLWSAGDRSRPRLADRTARL
jgi:drug/metabolite transporter (DMT)-like permease